MKKILLRLAFTGMAVGILLVCVLYVIVDRRHQHLANHKPLSLDRFDQLAKIEPTDTSPATNNPPPEFNTPPSALPDHLEETPTPKALAERWVAKDGKETGVLATVGAIGDVVESALWALGAEPTAARFAISSAMERMAAGNWDEARPYLEETIESSIAPYHFRDACARLAWLQEDPKEAARLLELSCRDDESMSKIIQGNRASKSGSASLSLDDWLVHTAGKLGEGTEGMEKARSIHAAGLASSLENAVALSRATGSDALAEHYLARLRLHAPEAAQRLDEKSPTSPHSDSSLE